MKRRHPRQVMYPAEFTPGADYTLVLATPKAALAVTIATFVGTLDNYGLETAMAAIGRFRGTLRLTFHRNGTRPDRYCLWGPADTMTDAPGFYRTGYPASLLADSAEANCDGGICAAHRLVVSLDGWTADPRLHVVDWENPDGSCDAGDWAAEEMMLRARKDMELRRLLGFG